MLLALVRDAARKHDGADVDEESEARMSDSEGVSEADERGVLPGRPPPATIERELSWSPSPPPEAHRPVDPFANVVDDGYSTTSSPGAGPAEIFEDDFVTSPEFALAQLAPASGKGKQPERLFMDDGGSSEDAQSDAIDVARPARAARPRSERSKATTGGGAKWQSIVDTYRMANDGEGGRLTFIFERVSLGADEAAPGQPPP